jgi:hypothetical protein
MKFVNRWMRFLREWPQHRKPQADWVKRETQRREGQKLGLVRACECGHGLEHHDFVVVGCYLCPCQVYRYVWGGGVDSKTLPLVDPSPVRISDSVKDS